MTSSGDKLESKIRRLSISGTSSPTQAYATSSLSSPTTSTGNPFHSRWSQMPMPGETEESVAERMKEATMRSKEIDEDLQETRKVLDRRKRAVKILLLGQSESGKSAFVKNFLLTFAPTYFDSTRSAWKLIVHLNLISNVRTIIETLKLEWDTINATAPQETPSMRNFRRVRLSLSPLFIIESNIMGMLAPGTPDPAKDVCPRSGSGWKAFVQARAGGQAVLTPSSGKQDGEDDVVLSKTRARALANMENDASAALISQKEDIIRLWGDPEVRNVLRRRKVNLEDMAAFFMDDVDRILSPDYAPTDSDIIRARLKTITVEELHFVFEKGADPGRDCFLIDVGGSRSHRASWVPYFDDVNAILFLAPLAFNKTLEEDPHVNRLEDSLSLWREICSNQLLAKANIVLFFNKRDVLVSALASNIRVKRYVPSYGDAPNDIAHVTKYFKEKFRSYHKRLSSILRPFMWYETSALDIKTMSVVLIGVKDSILRENLKQNDIL